MGLLITLSLNGCGDDATDSKPTKETATAVDQNNKSEINTAQSSTVQQNTLQKDEIKSSVGTTEPQNKPVAADKASDNDAIKNPNNPRVVFSTTAGDIEIEVFADEAPISAKNFMQYVKDGFYENTIFHRVISDFVIQGGGFDADMQRKETRAPIKNEADNGLKNKRGTLSMARTGQVDSATTQFFINTKDNTSLDHKSASPNGWGYAVFGQVVSGMEVVDVIRIQPTERKKGMSDVPIIPIKIESVKIVNE